MSKPRVLVLGGCGFIGRNLVSFLIKNELASAIRIVDKVLPQIAWLNEEHSKCFDNEIVEFKSANLINPESCKTAFEAPDGLTWDIVINCAGETKIGQTDPVYQEGILKLSLNCAKQASLHQTKHYVELSSGNMSSSEDSPHKENVNTNPWTFVAKWKLEVEKELSEIKNFPYTILRLPIVYGPADKSNLMPRILVAAIYRHINQTMKLLWDEQLKLNTVHVRDVCRAIWFVSNREDTIEKVYNVVDEANSNQKSISNLLGELFNISVEYYGNILSSCVSLSEAGDEANDKHLTPWAEACRRDGIQNTPLSPHMGVEFLLSKHLHLDGSRLRTAGFSYDVPKPTVENVKEIIEDYIRMDVFPRSLAP